MFTEQLKLRAGRKRNRSETSSLTHLEWSLLLLSLLYQPNMNNWEMTERDRLQKSMDQRNANRTNILKSMKKGMGGTNARTIVIKN